MLASSTTLHSGLSAANLATAQPRAHGHSLAAETEAGLWALLAAFGSGVLVVGAFWLLRRGWMRGKGPEPRRVAGSAYVAIDNIRDVVVLFRISDLRVVSANAVATALYGLPREELVNRTADQLEKIRPLGIDQIARTIALGTSPHFVANYKKADGSECTMEITTSQLEHHGEKCVLLVGHDVSDRVRAAEMAQGELQAFRTLFDRAPWATIVADAGSGQIVAANSAASDLFDHDGRGLEGLAIDRLLPGEEPDAASGRVAGVRTRDGAWRKVFVERSDVTFAGRRCQQYQCRPAETPEIAGESADVFDKALEAMLIIDPVSRTVVSSNPAAQRLYGYSAEELVGLTTDRVTTDPQGCREICKRVLCEGERSGELRYHRRKDGTMIAVEANFSPLSFAGRTCLLCSMRQISAASMRGAPIFTADMESPHRSRAKHATAPSHPASSAAHVLVVDDEPLVREVSRRMLQGAGLTVSVADDGVHAIEAVENDPTIDTVVLDVTMPGISGPDAMRRLFEIKPDLRVVLCSGYSSETVAIDDGPNGAGRAHAFVQKPFTVETLVAAVHGKRTPHEGS
jgi:PAS domain S-box-containing protein